MCEMYQAQSHWVCGWLWVMGKSSLAAGTVREADAGSNIQFLWRIQMLSKMYFVHLRNNNEFKFKIAQWARTPVSQPPIINGKLSFIFPLQYNEL